MTNLHGHASLAMLLATTVLFALLLASQGARAQNAYTPGNLLVSKSILNAPANLLVPGQTVLPGGGGATAVDNGLFGNIFTNEGPDPSFGVTTAITLDQVTRGGSVVGSQVVPGVVTSFSSKSELGLSLSADGRSVTFMGYNAPVNALDVSNSNTPGHPDPTNPVQLTYQRSVATVGANGQVTTQAVDAYSGNNGRNAITGSNGTTYLVGNAGNGTSAATAAVLADQEANTGVQIVQPGSANTGSAGQYNITQNGYAADKSSKDSNFRGETIFDNTLYVTKGSGGNGINTVYQVGTAGTLPTGSSNAVTILPGFNTTLAKTDTTDAPFGLFFANATTLYVSDEGVNTPPTAASPNQAPTVSAHAGTQKWSLVGGVWQLDYVLQNGLDTGAYSVTGTDAEGNLETVSATTTGLRNLTGIDNADGTVSLYAATATTSSLTDQGADPNSVLAINDVLSATTLPAGEAYTTLEGPQFATVYRGVTETPFAAAVPEPATLAVLGMGLLGLKGVRRRSV